MLEAYLDKGRGAPKLSLDVGGGSYGIRRADGTADVATLSDLRLIVGLERKVAGGINARFETGWVFSRQVDYQSSTTDFMPGDTFMVRAVPARIADTPYLELLKEIIEDLTLSSVARRLLVPHESAIIMASCKMAVKKGDPLTMDEMTRLLADLAQMRNPFTCPHGRPILLALSHHEMDRKFHRIGPH